MVKLTTGEKIARDLCEMDATIGNAIEVDPVDVARRIDEAMLELSQQLAARVRELEEENARLKRTNSSYANLTKAQESQLTNLRQRLYQLKGADSAIDSERQANCELTEQLAASQAYAEQLRVACAIAEKTIDIVWVSHHANRCDHALELCRKALTQPTSTEALDKYVAEKVKDSESRTGNQSPCYTIARDMAVRMWEKHYKTDAPNWEPLDDFMGVLSQISNMLTGLGNVEKITRQRDLAVEALKSCGVNDGLNGPTQYFDEDLVERAIKESEAK